MVKLCLKSFLILIFVPYQSYFNLIAKSSQLPVQSPDFFRERIDIKIDASTCQVKGTYYFKNISDSDISKMLYYPFVVNSDIHFPDSIRVSERIKSKNLTYSISKSGISFLLNIPSKSIAIIDVFFKQKTLAKKFEYILLTTQNWHNPLDYAEYYIEISNTFKMKFLSYPFKKLDSEENHSVFYLEQKIFKPQKNLIIQWEG